ncbi:MAG: hypothetical protein QM809_12695 [Gordonia sp. (in: high G+C Gram-positive bacteria)]|uniref:hypothetical protein n=1 Tax=Gordonia sp. (in: high G+C Gram-positive bacteria) TaxID=84139 RepID=UPI0039E3225C
MTKGYFTTGDETIPLWIADRPSDVDVDSMFRPGGCVAETWSDLTDGIDDTFACLAQTLTVFGGSVSWSLYDAADGFLRLMTSVDRNGTLSLTVVTIAPGLADEATLKSLGFAEPDAHDPELFTRAGPAAVPEFRRWAARTVTEVLRTSGVALPDTCRQEGPLSETSYTNEYFSGNLFQIWGFGVPESWD